MKNNFSNISFRLIVILLSLSILISGCHSYYTIPKEDYDKISTIEDIKIVYNDGNEIVVEKDDTTKAKIVGDSLIIHKGHEKDIIRMSNIEKIKENKFDLGATIAISLVGFTILLVLFLSSLDLKFQ